MYNKKKNIFLVYMFYKTESFNSQKYTVGNLHNFYEKLHVGHFGCFSFILSLA